METINLEIPAADFSFPEVVKRQANKLIEDKLSSNNFISPYLSSISDRKDAIKYGMWELSSQENKLVFLIEILNHFISAKDKYIEDVKKNPPQNYNSDYVQLKRQEVLGTFDDMKFYVYQLISDNCNYKFDKNAFTADDSVTIHQKLDIILSKLDRLECGEEIIFNEVEAFKESFKADIKSLESTTILGKDKWYKLLGGTALKYAGNKIFEIFLKQSGSEFLELMNHHFPNIKTIVKFLNP